MQLQSVKPGDIVEVNFKGRIYLAYVTGKEKGKVFVDPITPHVTYGSATSRQVVGHWRKSRRKVASQPVNSEPHESAEELVE